jgi:pectinesterase
VYREPVCVKSGTPITLYGTDAGASKVRIAYDNYNGKAVAGTKSNACQIPSGSSYGTTDSTSFFVKSNGFQAANLTIANDFTGSGQSVAMTSHGDKVVFQNVRFYGFQDTLQPGTSANGTVVRSYFKSCFIQGDTDFIMGAGVVVFDTCEINYIGTRKNSGCHLAPSTDGRQTYGMLIIHSRIVGGEGTKSGSAKLGRAWNNSGNPNANGQVVIRETEIDGHINSQAPWDTSTGGSKIPFDANKNRMFEYKNKGAGAVK